MKILKMEPEYDACFFWKLNDEGWFENFDDLAGCVFYARPNCLQERDRCDVYLGRPLPWEFEKNRWLPKKCRAHAHAWSLEINDDPRRPVFALRMNGKLVREFNHWPACWK